MKNKKARLALGLVVLVCACFTACDWENPVIGKWWTDPDPDPPYIALLKYIPIRETVYQTIIEEVVIWKDQPPAAVLRGIEIIAIEYILFSGDQSVYNENAKPPSVSSLGAAEKTYNNTTIAAVAKALADNPDYLLMLHGHANPTSFIDGETPDPGEVVELTALSEARANSVGAELNRVLSITRPTKGGDPPYPSGLTPDEMHISGYGGGKVLFPDNNIYTALNRRVEMILFRIITMP